MTNMELDALRKQDLRDLLGRVEQAARTLDFDLTMGALDTELTLHAALGLAEGFLHQVQEMMGRTRPDPA